MCIKKSNSIFYSMGILPGIVRFIFVYNFGCSCYSLQKCWNPPLMTAFYTLRLLFSSENISDVLILVCGYDASRSLYKSDQVGSFWKKATLKRYFKIYHLDDVIFDDFFPTHHLFIYFHFFFPLAFSYIF